MIWACLGPVFHYSDTWQLVINTGTTIITFLMVFLIQSAQNRDTEMLRLKLDAIILSIHNVSNFLIDLEALNDEQLEQLRQKITNRLDGSKPPRVPRAGDSAGHERRDSPRRAGGRAGCLCDHAGAAVPAGGMTFERLTEPRPTRVPWVLG